MSVFFKRENQHGVMLQGTKCHRRCMVLCLQEASNRENNLSLAPPPVCLIPHPKLDYRVGQQKFQVAETRAGQSIANFYPWHGEMFLRLPQLLPFATVMPIKMLTETTILLFLYFALEVMYNNWNLSRVFQDLKLC